MDHSFTFARHFSRLVWLLLNEPDSVSDQKAALRALVTVSKEGPVAMSTRQRRLVVNGTRMPEGLEGVNELVALLIGHGVRDLECDAGASAADLLNVARILAEQPQPGGKGPPIGSRIAAAGSTTVRVKSHAGGGEHFDLDLEVLTIEESQRISGLEPGRDAFSGGGGTPAMGSAPVSPFGVSDADDGAMLAFAAVRAPRESMEVLLAELQAATSPNAVTRLLEEVAMAMDAAVRDGRAAPVADAYTALVRNEAAAGEGILKHPYSMAIRRVTKPTVLRLVAQMLTQRTERGDDYFAALTRAGDDGAEALIEQLTNARTRSERRIYFDALVRLHAGVPALIHMLGDARWYVVRNAADLLGELQATQAEGPLAEIFRHDDERVRRAVAGALGKLGTPRAVQMLHQALRDSAPDVRMQAVFGIGAHKAKGSATTLCQAFDEETDGDVQLAIIGALGRLGAPDAVQKLIKIAEPEGRLFKKKPMVHRVAAVQALGEVRSPAASHALSELLADKEKEVREAAVRAVQGAGRESGVGGRD